MHVFVSYSHDDERVVRALETSLRAYGIETWIDSWRLRPGTPEWGGAIRSALNDAVALVCVCSPSAPASTFVPIEIEIARSLGKKVIPVWAAGDQWPSSAPLSLVMSQYIDLRGDRADAGFNALQEELWQLMCSLRADASVLHVQFGNAQIEILKCGHSTNASLLNEIYLRLLSGRYPPHSYGRTWALDISRQSSWYFDKPVPTWSWPYFALPAAWAANPMKSVGDCHPEWMFEEPKIWMGRVTASAFIRQWRISRKDDPTHRVRVVDLRSFAGSAASFDDTARPWDGLRLHKQWTGRFVGVVGTPGLAHIMQQGGHPKSTTSGLREADYRELEFDAALRALGVTIPRCEGVTADSPYFKEAVERIRSSGNGLRQWSLTRVEEPGEPDFDDEEREEW